MPVSVNEETIKTLKEVLEDEFPVLINTFLNDAALRVQELFAARDAGDIARMEQPAHTLKGSSSNVGAQALTTICAGFVEEIRSGTVIDATASIQAIESELETLNTLLRNYLD